MRRLHNNFFPLTRLESANPDMLVRTLEALLYQLFCNWHSQQRKPLIQALFAFNPTLAKYVDELTQAKGLAGLIKTVTGKSDTLIAFDDDEGAYRLELEYQSKTLLLPGPTAAVSGLPKAEKPRYPGHIIDPETAAADIDDFVGRGFEIADDLLSTIYDHEATTKILGRAFTAIWRILKNELPIYTVTEAAPAKKKLQRFSEPKRLEDPSLNILGNMLIALTAKHPSLKTGMIQGAAGLAEADKKLFSSFRDEFFCDTGKLRGSETQSRPSRAEQAHDEPPQRLRAAADCSIANPLQRLENISLSKLVDFRKLGSYDSYAREILSLILCGKTDPHPEELASGCRQWQQLVHPDKNPGEPIKDFSRLINDIGHLAKREEFIFEEASRAVAELFTQVEKLLDISSVTVIPRQGHRHIIVGETSLEDIMARERVGADAKILFRGALISPNDFSQVRLAPGNIVEIVNF